MSRMAELSDDEHAGDVKESKSITTGVSSNSCSSVRTSDFLGLGVLPFIFDIGVPGRKIRFTLGVFRLVFGVWWDGNVVLSKLESSSSVGKSCV